MPFTATRLTGALLVALLINVLIWFLLRNQ